MAAIEILRLAPDATREELVKQVNRLTDLLLGNDGARTKFTGYDGVERDLQTGGSLSSGNYQTFIKSAGTNHLQVQHSSGTPDVLLVQDAGLTIVGTVDVTGDTTITGDLTTTGDTHLGDNGASDTLVVDAIETHNGAATFVSAATFNGAMTLGNAAADAIAVNGTMTLPAIDPPTVAGQATQASVSSGWAYVTYSGSTPTLQDSYNVTSITDDGVGLLTITWDRDFASANYAVVPMCGSGGIGGVMPTINIQAAGTCQVAIYGHAGALADPASIAVVAFGLLS